MRSLALLLTAALAATLCAQTPEPTLKQHPPQDATATLKASTQLVVIDVVVQDSHGKPVHGLKREDFTLNEDKKPQTLRHFDERSNLIKPAAGPQLPPLPPGTFTDYTPTPPDGALNILLLDALNTPMQDQSYVRYELQQYVKHADPGTRIAIFGLAQRLYILQGFSSDPEVLKDAVQHKLLPRSSPLLDDPTGSGTVDESLGLTSANLSDFEAEAAAAQTQLRIQYTLDAFNVLAHYLSAFPGRKNLIWFSGSFPINIMPDPELGNPFAVMQTNDEEFRETTNLLARSQVAVYPVDARGLMTDPTFSASRSGRGEMRNPGKTTAKFLQSQAEEHSTMEQLAEDTGGAAFYNNNDLSKAVSQAIEAGSNYYTLTYTPENKKWDGSYREVRVSLNGALAGQKLKLAYRHGYYADDPGNPKQANTASATTEAALSHAGTGAAYARASMARAAPTPEDILFKVRVLPATAGTETELAKGNAVDPKSPIKPPYRRFLIDYAALSNAFQVTLDANTGRRSGEIEFTTLLYDPDGKLLNAAGETVKLNLDAETYKTFRKGVAAHLEISAPVKGETYLRIAVHDVPSNKFGVVEIPVSSVAKLAPQPAPVAPAAEPPAK